MAAKYSSLEPRRYRFATRYHADILPAHFGVYHGSELPFVFGGMGTYVLERFNTSELALSQEMGRRWGRFASTGDAGADWPAYANATDAALVFSQDGVTVEHGWRAGFCDFWNQIYLL
jgi:carboxylesterase type B